MVVDHDMVSGVDTVSISQFKATCLARLERVRRTGRPLLVTRRGEPIAEITPPSRPARRASWLGALRATGRITGDIVSPALDADEWDALSG